MAKRVVLRCRPSRTGMASTAASVRIKRSSIPPGSKVSRRAGSRSRRSPGGTTARCRRRQPPVSRPGRATAPTGAAAAIPAGRDRGREVRLPGLPSLRTVRAVLPHTALRLPVASIGLDFLSPGTLQRKESCFGKEGVGVTPMIQSATATTHPGVATEDRTQTHPYPPV